jgi:hypothetical protein
MSSYVQAQYSGDYSLYYNYCNKAARAKATSDYLLAIQLYEMAFEKYYPFIDDLKELKECYKHYNMSYKVKQILERMILIGYTCEYQDCFIYDKEHAAKEAFEIIPLDEKDIFNTINYDSLYNLFAERTSSAKNRCLESFIIADDFVNNMRWYYLEHPNIFDKYINLIDTFLKDPKRNIAYNLSADMGFSTNGRLFISLAKNGYLPSRKESSFWESEQFIGALLHSGITLQGTLQDTFINILKQHIESGDIQPLQYAVIYDHITRYKWGNSGYYGTAVITMDDENIIQDTNNSGSTLNGKHFQLLPPYGIENVDKRRSEIYLYPMWIQAKLLNQKLPKEYNYDIDNF